MLIFAVLLFELMHIIDIVRSLKHFNTFCGVASLIIIGIEKPGL